MKRRLSNSPGVCRRKRLSPQNLFYKKCKINFALLVFALAAIIFPLRAQSPLIEVAAAVDKSVITIGDRVTYTLKIDRKKGLKVHDPGKGTNLGMFEIKEYVIHDSVTTGERVTQQFDYVISVYDTGRFVIPPFPVAFLPTDTSSKYQIITSQPLEIYVKSLVNDPNAEIHDIRPPLGIPVNYLRLALMIGSLLLGLAVLGFAYWMYRRSKQGQPVFRKEPPRPAHEIALAELQKLLQSGLLAAGEYKLFYSELSNIARRYMERRFFINAMEETTSEILDSLKNASLSPDQIELAREMLTACDLVKFAKYVPGSAETESAVELVREFIERTRPVFEPAGEVQVEASK